MVILATFHPSLSLAYLKDSLYCNYQCGPTTKKNDTDSGCLALFRHWFAFFTSPTLCSQEFRVYSTLREQVWLK